MLARLRSLILMLVRRRDVEQDMDDEWRFHLESRIDALVDSGLDRVAAEAQARREFGPAMKWKEESREARGFAAVDGLRRDATYALRQVRRAPGFALLIVLTLAIGIGATTAMFSVVDAVLLRPLRFPGADRASEVWWRPAEGTSAQPGIPALTYTAVRESLADAAHVEGYRFGSGTIVGGAEPLIVPIPEVSSGLLPMVGAAPIAGRHGTGCGRTRGECSCAGIPALRHHCHRPTRDRHHGVRAHRSRRDRLCRPRTRRDRRRPVDDPARRIVTYESGDLVSW